MADRHYNRQKPGSPQFVPPGKCKVFLGLNEDAVWVTSWPHARYVKHEWAGAWVNSMFRNESDQLASKLIKQAVSATLYFWPEPPELGLITFIDSKKVRPTKVHGEDTWGYCYLKAGFSHVGYTKGGLLAFQLLPSEMPQPLPPVGISE